MIVFALRAEFLPGKFFKLWPANKLDHDEWSSLLLRLLN